MWRQRHCILNGLLLAILALAVSCKTSDDAKALATQMTSTAKSLSDYYSALADVVDDHAELERLQQATIGVPLDQQEQAQLQDVKKELQQRADAAKALDQLAQAFTGLTGSKAPSDVSESATELGTALSSVQNLPGAADAADALPSAGQILTQFAQEHDERKMAKSMDPTMAALSKMFSQEKSTYESIERTYIGLAQSIAFDLVKKNEVDPGSLMEPALKPFDLTSRIPTENLPQGLTDYAREQIKDKGEADIAAHAKASDTMDKTLQEMSKRTHELATTGSMSQRGLPFTLDNINAWTKSKKKSAD